MDNNQMLIDLTDIYEANYAFRTANGGVHDAFFKIAVQAWVHDGTGTGEIGITEAEVERYIRYVNQFYENNDVSIFLYLKCVINRPITKFYDDAKDDNYDVLYDDYYQANALNIHFVHSSETNNGRFPWKSWVKNKPYACFKPMAVTETTARTV